MYSQAARRTVAPSSASLSTAAARVERAIHGDSIIRDIREPASDRFLGRAVGTAGEDSATSCLARRFAEIGLGVVAPEQGWDDFKGVDVRGKTIIMLKTLANVTWMR